MKSERVRGGANQNLERIYGRRSGQRELVLGMAQIEEIFHPGPLSPSRGVEVASPAEGVRDRRPGGDGSAGDAWAFCWTPAKECKVLGAGSKAIAVCSHCPTP